MEITKNDLIFIYDITLHRKLQQENKPLLFSAISLKDKQFWLYQRTQEIQEIMIQHSKRK